MFDLAGAGGIVSGQIRDHPTIRTLADHPDEGPDAGIILGKARVAEVEILVPNAEEPQAQLRAGQTEADAHVGPAATDRLGDPPMVVGEASGRGAASEDLIEALPGTGPSLSAHPGELGLQRRGD